ncbi:MAG: hypothetical protein AAF355_05275 [Myxococcota bacterium]
MTEDHHSACLLWRTRFLFVIALSANSISACGDSSSSLDIVFCGDFDASSADALRVVATSISGVSLLEAVVGDASAKGEELTFPLSTSVPTLTLVGSGFVRAEARSAGVIVGSASIRVLDFTTLSSLEFPLSESCRGVLNCDFTQTCTGGICETAPLPQDAPRCGELL